MPRAFDTGKPVPLHDPTRTDLNFNIDRKFDLMEIRQVMWESMFNEIGLWWEERTGIDLLHGWEGFITSVLQNINLKIEARQLNIQEFLVRIRDHNQTFLNNLYDGLMGNAEGTTTDATWQDVYLVTHSARDRADEAFRTAAGAAIANNVADLVTDLRAAAGSNLVLSPNFSNAEVKRFPLNDVQQSGYSILEETHSGLQSWKWTHVAGIPCGFTMAPTPRISHFDVVADEEYLVESWLYSDGSNPTANGSIQIGCTLSDSTEVLEDVEDYVDFPLDGTEVVAAQWNKLNHTVTIPEGFDTARFWIRSTADVAEGAVFWIDDVAVRDWGASGRAVAHADWLVGVKARAGSNLMLDPDFSNGTLTRHPYNLAQVYGYAKGQGAHYRSGLQSWTWTQETGAACGLVFAPTEKVDTFQVAEGDSYLAEAYLFPESGYQGAASTIRIGATLTDSSGVNPPVQIYESPEPPAPPGDDQPDMPLVAGQWNHLYATVTVPAGYDTAKFWVIATSNSPAGSQFWVDDVKLRETSAANTLMDTLYDAMMGFPRGTSTGINWHDVYMALSQKSDHAEEAFTLAVAGEIADTLANLVTDMRAAAGANLFLSPKFSDSTLDRFPLNDIQASGYSLGEERHSGLQSWKWFHSSGIDCGIALAPTTRINHFDVTPGEEYLLSAWIFPKATNHTSTGSIRIGGTFTDTSGAQQDSDVYVDFPLNGPDMPKDNWNLIATEVTVPDGFDRVKFWVKSTAATHDSDCFWIDDVTVKEQTVGRRAERLADKANRIVNYKAKAGANLVVSPKFSSSLVDRHPYNIGQVCGYASGAGEQKHSGFQSWKWVQENNSACGLILSPTEDVETFEVQPDEVYFVESWVFPAANGGSTGSVRIGVTFSDSAGVQQDSDVYEDFPITGSDMQKGQWNKVNTTVTVPDGFDTAKFWVIATAATALNSTFWVDDVTVREGTEASKASFVVDMRAKAGANLVVSPTFSSRAVNRFPYNNAQDYGYSYGVGSERHSGLQSWRWTQETNAACGLILAPTGRVESFDVQEAEEFFVEAYVHPAAGNPGSSGAVRIGVTFSDSSGVEDDSDVYSEWALSSTDMSKGQWNKINHTVTVPEGYDTATFWVIATAATTSGSVFFIDDVTVREQAAANKAQRQADRANRIVGFKARAGANLVVSPKFSSSLVDRHPYNTNQVYGYAAGQSEQKHSGLQSWKWTQESNAACGLVLSPTEDVDTFEVNGSETFLAEAWVYPAAAASNTGSVRIGVTLSDSSGVKADSDLYADYPLNGQTMLAGQWNQVTFSVDVPLGFDTARFWVIATAATVANRVFWIDDVVVKEDTESARAKLAAEKANRIVNAKAQAGSNLVVSPKFSNSLIDRFPFEEHQFCEYSATQHHSGLQSWKWVHEYNYPSGLILAPTPDYDSFEVQPDEEFFVEVYLYPAATNTVTAGSIRVGGTLSDSSGVLQDSDVYLEWPVDGTDVVRGQWNKLNHTVVVSAGYDTAKFWVQATGNVPGGSAFWVDDVTVKEVAASKKAQAQADYANWVTDLKSRAGANLVIDPKFGAGGLVTRFPYNTNQVSDYSMQQHHSGLVSWKWTQESGAACGFVMNPTAKVDTFQVQEDEQWYVEAWLYASSSNSGTAGAIWIGGTFSDSEGYLSPVMVYTETLMSAVTKGQWALYSTSIATPAGYDTAKFWIIATSATSSGSVFYVDDVAVKSDNGAVALSAANLAVDNTQAVIDAVEQAVDGGSATGSAPSTVREKLKSAWANLWDGLGGTSGATSKLPSDVKTVAAALKSATTVADANATTGIANAAAAQSTANSASSAAGTAQSTANTANSTANTATTNLQTVVDATVQAVDGGSATGAAHSTVKTKLQLAWARTFDGLSNNALGTNTEKTSTDLHTAGLAARGRAELGVTNASTADGKAVTADGKAVTAQTNLQTVVDSTVQAVDGGSATGAAHSAVKTKLQLAWARVFDGLSNNALGTNTAKVSADLHTAGLAARGRAELGVTNAATADGKAVTADGKAVTADGKAVAAQSTANTASSNASTADGKAVVADGKAVTADLIGIMGSATNSLILDPDFSDTTIRRSAPYSSAGEPSQGNRSLKFTVVSASIPRINLNPIKADNSAIRFPISSGQILAFDIWMYAPTANAGTGALEITLFMRDAAGSTSYAGNVIGTLALSKGTWQRLTGTYTIPTYITGSAIPFSGTIAAGAASASVGDIFYIDRAFVWLK